MLRLSMTSLQRFNKINYIVLRNFAKKFTKEHEWVEVEKDVATIGITDFAQSELGEIVHVDLPAIGNHYKIQETLGGIESVKTAADIYSPVEGTVIEVNDNLGKTPKLLNTHPTSQGWYAKLKADEKSLNSNVSGLMNENEYEKYLADLKK